MPLDLPELAVVADRFHISPLLPLLTGDGHFFVVALSQNRLRVLEGTRDRLEEVHLPGVPLGVRDALHGEEAQKQLQKYHHLAGTGLTSRDPREIIRAAKQGRVETLFAARQPPRAGSTNGSPSPNGDRALRDVLEVAAVATLVKGAPCTRCLRGRRRGVGAPRRSSGASRRWPCSPTT